MATEHPSKQALWIGGILIAIGLLFFLDNIGLFDFDFLFENFWPLLLIAIGAYIIYKSANRSKEARSVSFGDHTMSSSDEYVNASNTFGDLNIKVDASSFKGGQLRTTFGELHVDLSNVSLNAGQNVLNLNVTFGEIAVSLPKDLPIRIVANNVGGDIRLFDQKWEGLNKRASWQSESYADAETKLDIICNIVFGDIKVW